MRWPKICFQKYYIYMQVFAVVSCVKIILFLTCQSEIFFMKYWVEFIKSFSPRILNGG